ncbi:aldehyde dehydrogenase [Haloechinothrix sp. YIM 98757]|uniref:Aldehyde dehydrogenase n=1 Tax=Haloechinothrix aidingensis TaxID=2752311 RepID=A0A838AC51_9PSEU|nr:aldehyde dehydrogenase [Haloechinothrix aidingensis]MBA0126807.1 aldehyde dehydrogenase [Haloechinothrix aidingensis]
MHVEYDRLFIGGDWVAPSSASRIDVTSASTEEPIGRVPGAREEDVGAAVNVARRAFDDPAGWSGWQAGERAAAMERLADELVARSEETVRRVSSQNGMPVSIGEQSEALFPSLLLGYYATLIQEQPGEERRPAFVAGTTVVRRDPVGVVAAVVPWNFPQSLSFFKIAPALAAGCTVVLKPAPETVLDAFVIAEAAEAAGLPPGVINIVPGDREVGAALVAHPGVDKVSFTGSTAAGRAIGEVCGRLLRPVTLELGGKSAAIVLDDADLPSRFESLFQATLMNSGQTCYVGTRILAPRNRYDSVVEALTAMVRALKLGDPLDPATELGPLVSERQRDRVEAYISAGRSEGARLVSGGKRPAEFDRGWYVEPTVFADVDNDSTIAREEIFGPVLSVIPYSTVDEAVAIANDSEYGLGGSVWSADPERAESVAARVQTGSIGINNYMLDPGAPFGGVKASGIGRELGPEGLEANQVTKSIYLEP